ncbi:DUF308 domain-containing protein [Agromyces sp. Marseille-Q5079]|uniref:DUF308 domain-containing protein n=1 Tax=Agromyces sp. Marseille-Q5079 TaxID=3439059 RepID=UPI003D9C9AB1
MTDTQQPVHLQPTPPAADQPQQPADQSGLTPAQEKKSRNVLGIVALALAAVGFIFACVPGALILGWVLLPIAFTLAIIAVCLKGKAKWQGFTAIVVSVIGTIVGIIVFSTVVATSFTNAFGSTDVEIASGDDTSIVEEGEAPVAEEEPAAEVGTRENPAAIGSTIEGDDWTVVVNSVTPGATDAVLAANQFNEAPDAGTEYIVINYTATYTGDDADGQMPAFVGLEYVTADGVTVDGLDKMVVAPDAIDSMSTLYTGASAAGNAAIQVPSPADGVIAVRPGMIADKVFVAIQ